ncbi:MAG: ribosomal protein small subunit ribosomal protein [Parcubacteria group bacterium]|nr:ribosomal protein small subunit ribosomal protein [Parcubacteria group bacterium]
MLFLLPYTDMLKIRLQRVGRKHEPAFRLVLTDSKNSTKSGRFKEILGSYDARKDVDLVKTDRVKYWLSQGVGLTGSVHNLFIKHKVIDAKKINVLPKKTYTAPVAEAIPETPKKEEAAAEPVVEETPVAEPAAEEIPAPDTAPAESTPAPEAPVVE